MPATAKGATLTEGQELLIGEHRVIIVKIDCPAKKVRVRAVSTEHVVVQKTRPEDKQQCKTTT